MEYHNPLGISTMAGRLNVPPERRKRRSDSGLGDGQPSCIWSASEPLVADVITSGNLT